MALCGAHTTTCSLRLCEGEHLPLLIMRGSTLLSDARKVEKRGKKGKKYLYILQSLYSRVLLSPPCCFHPRAASPPCCFHPRAASPPCCFHPRAASTHFANYLLKCGGRADGEYLCKNTCAKIASPQSLTCHIFS
ncbi:hypothetical protein POVWA1_045620 [Plasmodium ovale wallikeri]|uniref:Uncharacterized protein n=1 Tax=Plasmodium ovale wallikeri TaxID=864142 RepID=A0A1A8ZEL8_PLAOA|nr:hypothetical protein POVWA1_045620 [Plasmodium ovale wallikeri]